MADRRIADQAGEDGKRGNGSADGIGPLDLGMGGGGADRDHLAACRDALQLAQTRDVDQVGRRREALLHGRDERLAAGEIARLGSAGEERRRLMRTLPDEMCLSAYMFLIPVGPWPLLASGHGRGAGLDGTDDVVIAGAAADVTLELVADGRLVELWAEAADHVTAVMIIPGVQKPHCRP